MILCVGETLEEREANRTKEVVESQLKPVVDTITKEDWAKVVIAYEPVWAIGTGKVASAAQAQEAHADIRAFLAKAVSPEVAESVRIIYGGSVTAANSKELGASSLLDDHLSDAMGILIGAQARRRTWTVSSSAARPSSPSLWISSTPSARWLRPHEQDCTVRSTWESEAVRCQRRPLGMYV